MLEGKKGFRVVREEEELVSYAYQTVGEYNLNIGVVTPLRESLHLIIELFTMLTVALLVMYLLVILCSLIIVKSVTGPILWMKKKLKEMLHRKNQIEDEKIPYQNTQEIISLKEAADEVSNVLQQLFSVLEEESSNLN